MIRRGWQGLGPTCPSCFPDSGSCTGSLCIRAPGAHLASLGPNLCAASSGSVPRSCLGGARTWALPGPCLRARQCYSNTLVAPGAHHQAPCCWAGSHAQGPKQGSRNCLCTRCGSVHPNPMPTSHRAGVEACPCNIAPRARARNSTTSCVHWWNRSAVCIP